MFGILFPSLTLSRIHFLHNLTLNHHFLWSTCFGVAGKVHEEFSEKLLLHRSVHPSISASLSFIRPRATPQLAKASAGPRVHCHTVPPHREPLCEVAGAKPQCVSLGEIADAETSRQPLCRDARSLSCIPSPCHLLSNYNDCLLVGTAPDHWKLSKVVMI